jgi:hypothetical protein
MRRLSEANDVKELREIYAEELLRKDKIIEKLKEENLLLIKMSLRSAGERAEINELIKKMRK